MVAAISNPLGVSVKYSKQSMMHLTLAGTDCENSSEEFSLLHHGWAILIEQKVV